ncbi:MAG: hypothetical protein JNL78_01975 [Rhodocyclaceae bacterium]|jgi:uncharacterized protein (DUF4213/DUF364 family)|nr:hypothetical protein [Rhodocyclaceae bacterium]
MASPVRRWLIDAAQRIDAALGPARVKRIVLPPQVDQPGKEGEFCAVQLDCGSVGLAFTLLDGTLAALHARGADSGRAAMDLVRGYAEGDGAARALGLAAINALTRRLYDRAGFVPDDSVDSFGSLGLKAGDRLGMVGHFTPLIEQARALGIPVTVLELKAELVREEAGLVVTLDPGRLAGCNKIVSTSTLLLNDTFEAVSAAWRGAEAVAIVGPSAGCPPDALFAAGVSAVGAAWVVDAEAFLARVAAGGKWGPTSRKVTLTPQHYPGLDALLAKAG